mmetsp:Transcript_33445/g.66316  ORF Transcript_33445/g.66316 Transcript_33445/m.66316 type:complete len:251 (-) Transcript_33445:260-1012(-)
MPRKFRRKALTPKGQVYSSALHRKRTTNARTSSALDGGSWGKGVSEETAAGEGRGETASAGVSKPLAEIGETGLLSSSTGLAEAAWSVIKFGGRGCNSLGLFRCRRISSSSFCAVSFSIPFPSGAAAASGASTGEAEWLEDSGAWSAAAREGCFSGPLFVSGCFRDGARSVEEAELEAAPPRPPVCWRSCCCLRANFSFSFDMLLALGQGLITQFQPPQRRRRKPTTAPPSLDENISQTSAFRVSDLLTW